MKRYLHEQIEKDLKKKMVFVGGPRQVGKTTLALGLLQGGDGYLNWDVPEHRQRILKWEIPADVPRVALDEIHKFRTWRNYLKGLYDSRKGKQEILVTGSARLDYYRHGGDSLQGRYHYLRMHPLSVAELGIRDTSGLRDLMTLGGFPEPYFGGSETEARRWSLEYRSRLVQEDLASLERVQDLGRIELLMLELPGKVGSPLSVNSLREDLQVTHKTAAHWVDILERLYAVFRVPPFGAPRLRAVKKEQKHYHFDWSLVPEEGPRFENLVACHLLKWAHFQRDALGREVELRYFRDVTLREVDFVLCEGKKPTHFIECKAQDAELHPGLKFLKERFPKAEAWQLSLRGEKDYLSREGIRVAPAWKFLEGLV
jgi:uncharacterized protein